MIGVHPHHRTPSQLKPHPLPRQQVPLKCGQAISYLEVQVVRHTSPLTPSQLPDTTASLLAPTVTSSTQLPVRAARSGKFSSDFVQFGALSSLREEDRGGEGGIVGERRGEEGGREEEEEGERRTEDTSSSQHPMLPDTSSQSSTQPVPGAPVTATADNSSETQKKKPRKPKGKVVPSRYLSSTKSTPSVSNKTLSTSTATATIHRTQQLSKKTSRSAQRAGRKDSSKVSSRVSSSSVAPSSSLSTTLPRHLFTPSGLTSSTPKVGSQLLAQSVPTTALQGSFTDASTTAPVSNTYTATRPSTLSRHRTKTPAASGSIGGHPNAESEVELLYCRLLQASYLDVKSAKALRVQEEAAKTQLHTLWREVEERRKECQRLRGELETVRRNTVLSSVLDVQAKELAPVISSLPRLQQQHSALAVSLDATRHELPTSGLIPATERTSSLPRKISIFRDTWFSPTRSTGDRTVSVGGAALRYCHTHQQQTTLCKSPLRERNFTCPAWPSWSQSQPQTAFL
ncbi:HAUS augmin-like complex subunit 8 [Geodia barretti]|uniref:HAUS augmin-like complex subunit 8 n=1 Tax=Geodia barretti TaxID=519541 RepID=A0AA35WQU4_GEOBA|nr:HAUS augmin-like complex subunit 8 [Geodia barretti]